MDVRSKQNLSMLCDFYELTMGNGYLRTDYGDKICYFDLFFRQVPDGGGYAIAAGLEQVVDYIADTYHGAVISVVENPTDGYDPDVDYDALAGSTIIIEATVTPHSEILNDVVADILAEKDLPIIRNTFPGGHDWSVWRRCVHDFLPRIFKD